MAHESVRVGVGAGMSDDRIPPGVELVEKGDIDYLVMECLAERTIARESLDRVKDASRGYTPTLPERVRAVLPPCRERGVRIVSNAGAANPVSGGDLVRREAREMGLGEVSCAVVVGDEVTDIVRAMPELPLMEDGAPLESILPRMACANAYLGADMVKAALDTGADVVLTGRVADPSLFLGTIMHHLDWSYDDYDRLAVGTVAGHMLECAGQLTGGCFADPGIKDVEDLVRLGFPYADVSRDGSLTLGKTPGSGGRLDRMTCTEQLLYEMHDPTRYITPDCVLDVSDVEFEETAKNEVAVRGMAARPRTDTLKVVVGYHDGYIGTGEITYAGVNAVGRAKLAAEVVKGRLKDRGFTYEEMRVDLIGISSLHGEGEGRPEPYEVRLRVAARSQDRKATNAVGVEVRAMHMNGPAGAGGGINLGSREILAVKSVLLPRHLVKPQVIFEGRA